MFLGRFDRLRRAASGPKPVAVRRKLRFPQGTQDLMHRLLDQTVQDRRDAQNARASAWLWNVHPANRAGPILSVEELLFNDCPILLQIWAKLSSGHAVNAGRSTVALYRLQSPEHVLALKHRFDESWLTGDVLYFLTRKVCAAFPRTGRLPARLPRISFEHLISLFWPCLFHRADVLMCPCCSVRSFGGANRFTMTSADFSGCIVRAFRPG